MGEVAASGVKAVEKFGFAREVGEDGDGGRSWGFSKVPEDYGGGGEVFERARKERTYELFFVEEMF